MHARRLVPVLAVMAALLHIGGVLVGQEPAAPLVVALLLLAGYVLLARPGADPRVRTWLAAGLGLAALGVVTTVFSAVDAPPTILPAGTPTDGRAARALWLSALRYGPFLLGLVCLARAVAVLPGRRWPRAVVTAGVVGGLAVTIAYAAANSTRSDGWALSPGTPMEMFWRLVLPLSTGVVAVAVAAIALTRVGRARLAAIGGVLIAGYAFAELDTISRTSLLGWSYSPRPDNAAFAVAVRAESSAASLEVYPAVLAAAWLAGIGLLVAGCLLAAGPPPEADRPAA